MNDRFGFIIPFAVNVNKLKDFQEMQKQEMMQDRQVIDV